MSALKDNVSANKGNVITMSASISNNEQEGYKNDEDVLEGLQSDHNWQSAFMRVICMAWENDNVICFEYTDDNDNTVSVNKNIADLSAFEVRMLFKSLCDYDIPANLNLTLAKFEGDAEYDSKARNSKENGWSSVLNEKSADAEGHEEYAYAANMAMMIPPKPSTAEAFAITDYLSSGKAYPFTSV